MGSNQNALPKVVKTFWRTFFAIEQDDNAANFGIRIAQDGASYGAYQLGNWWLSGVYGAMVIALDANGAPFGWIVLAAFSFDVAIVVVCLWIAIASGRDFTLGSNVRRGVDAISGLSLWSRAAGYIIFCLVIVVANIWNGPEQIIMMLVRNIRTEWRSKIGRLVLLTIVLTLAQTLPWALFWIGAWRAGNDIVSVMT